MVLYVRDILERDFLVLDRKTNVLEAAKAMKEKKHGFVVVGPSRDRPEGMVTEWDVLAKVVAEAKDPASVMLEDIMSTELVSIKASEAISSLAQFMSEKGVRRVLVLDKGAVIGVVTSKDVLARLNDYVNKISSQISRLQAPWF